MSKIHVNPKTGEPGECRAKKRCRFGADTPHHESVEEALDHYAETNNLDTLGTKQKMTKGVKILTQLAALQQQVHDLHDNFQKVEDRYNENDDYMGAAHDPEYIKFKTAFDKTVEKRNAMDNRLNTLTWDHSDEPTFDPDEKVVLPEQPSFVDEDGVKRQGINEDNKSEEKKAAYELLDRAGKLWLSRLSTAELKAVLTYNKDSEEYAILTSGKSDEKEMTEDEANYLKYFNSAVAKAPRSDKPFRVFAGISSERVKDLHNQASQGSVVFDRVQSSSLNPAQVNSFMYSSSDTDGDKENKIGETVFEIETTSVASLSFMFQHRQEMEILIPAGEYKVSKKMHNVSYAWGTKWNSARKAETTFIMKEV